MSLAWNLLKMVKVSAGQEEKKDMMFGLKHHNRLNTDSLLQKIKP